MDELMRDRFMELVYDLLRDDDSNQRANAIINCADEYAESMKQRWIPVEERLPEPWSLVLVTDTCKNVSMCQMSWGNKNWYDESENWMYFPDDVIAWMPLPEYYQEEGEDKE